jgi:hypothetical protein
LTKKLKCYNSKQYFNKKSGRKAVYVTSERAKLLGELITEMDQEPRGFIPEEAWGAVQKAFALPYIELAIIRCNPESGQVEILLSHRTDQHWAGWHIPGGLWRKCHTRDECIASLVKTENLGGAAISVLTQGEWEKWHDHPYGNPISHVVICTGENIVETETERWFSSVPDGMISDNGHHARFIENVLRFGRAHLTR